MYPKKKSNVHFKLILVGTLAALSFGAFAKLSPSTALEREWQMSLDRNLNDLDDSGRLDPKNFPWADAPWSAVTGGLLDRYKREDLELPARANQRTPMVSELQKMSFEKRSRALELLAPAEIFDLFRGYSVFPLSREVRAAMKKEGTTAFDEKMNFGWAVATTMMAEPDAVRDLNVRIPPRIDAKITLGSSDVKGLLSYYFGAKVPHEVKLAKAGARCHGAEDSACKRLDPASFHILLTNMIAKKGKPFIADLDPSKNVNYRPIVGYTADIRRENENFLTVTTKVEYVRKRAAQIEPYGFYNLDTEEETYRYTLKTDASGMILSGEWLSEAHPEFVWRVTELPKIRSAYSALNKLYEETPLK